MINYIRRNKDPYSWSYHDDLIAARGENLHYHMSLGVGAEFDVFLEKFHSVAPKQFNAINFLSASETESQLPMIGMISPHFAILRVLEHPIAKEFVSYIPWVYRETFFAMKQLVRRIQPSETLPDIYKNIEDIRWVDHKIARRSMLEDVVNLLHQVRVSRCWEAIPSETSFEKWILQLSHHIRRVCLGEEKHVELPLPHNEELRMPMTVFWMQLLDVVLGYRYKKWKLYWTEEKMLLMNGSHDPAEVSELLGGKSTENRLCKLGVACEVGPDLTLMQLLSCWGAKLKLQ